MAAILALLLIVALFGGGFASTALFYVAGIFLLLWIIGFMAHGTDARWYRW